MPDWKQEIRGRLQNLQLEPARERAIIEELAQYLDDCYQDLLASGSSEAQAHRAALAELSGSEILERELRRVERQPAREPIAIGNNRRMNMLADLWQDLRYGARLLGKRPGFNSIVVLTLALGLGASTAIFSAAKPILFEPLPYPHSDRIAVVWDHGPDGVSQEVTFGTYRELAERSRSFDSLAVLRSWQPAITGDSEPERLEGQRVSASYLRVLGARPALGADFDPADDRVGGPKNVILSRALFERRYGADPQIIGRQITLDETPYTIIGVMPASFENPLAPAAQLWTLLQYDASLPAFEGREWGHHLRMIGRLRVPMDRAREEITEIARARVAEFARPPWASFENGLIVNSLQDEVTRGVRPALLATIVAVILLLAIACVNVTNMLLARGAERRGEFAIRAALGANRARMIRQIVSESLLLAALGGALGFAAAEIGVKAIVALGAAALPRAHAISLDGIVFAFGFALTTIVGLLIGLIPALEATRARLCAGIEQISPRAAGGWQLARRSLVVAEVALALLLLTGAGLLLRSLERLFAVDPGFDASRLVTLEVQTSSRRFDKETTDRYFARTLEAVRGVPGVAAAAFTSQLPLGGEIDEYGAHFEPLPGEKQEGGYSAFRYAVSPGYFEAARIPLRRGRLLDERDAAGAPLVALISESLARRKFSGADPIGRRLRIGDGALYTIVGVVGDVRQVSLAVSRADAVYTTSAQWRFSENALSLLVRAEGDAAALAPAIRQAIWSVDSNQPIAQVATMEQLLAASAAERRFALILFETFGLLAIVLAATGIYGVLSTSVSERRREIGVRMALGAQRRDVFRLVLGQGLVMTAIGIAFGLGGAMAATRFLRSLLYEISPTDPVTFAATPILLVMVALLACSFPARRATRVDPLVALRGE